MLQPKMRKIIILLSYMNLYSVHSWHRSHSTNMCLFSSQMNKCYFFWRAINEFRGNFFHNKYYYTWSVCVVLHVFQQHVIESKNVDNIQRKRKTDKSWRRERERAGSYVSVLIHVMYHSRKQYRGTNLLWSHNHFILTTWLNKYLVHIFYGKNYNMKPSIPKHTCMYANIYRAIWTLCSRNSVFIPQFVFVFSFEFS